MIFLLDGGGVIIQLNTICDSQLQVWFSYWIEGGDHSVWNFLQFSAPGMRFILEGRGWLYFVFWDSNTISYWMNTPSIQWKYHTWITHHFQLNDHSPPSNRNIIPGAENHILFPTLWSPPPSNRIVIPGAEKHTSFQLNDHPSLSNRNIIPGAENHKKFPTEES